MLSIMVALFPALVATSVKPSPWDGLWTLDAARSSPGAAEQAAEGYRFRIGDDGRISWEIPSLGEVVLGKTDDTPMVVRRAGKDNGARLSVTADGPAILRYRVSENGHVIGGGRMTLIDGGMAWVDVTWGPQGPPYAAELIYVRSRPEG